MSTVANIGRRPGPLGRALGVPGPAWLVLPLFLLGVAVGWTGRGGQMRDEFPQPFEGFRQVRIKTIQTQLDQVRGPYIAILGDSHAERLYLPDLCGLPVVNAGLSGATLHDVLDLARRIEPPHPARAVLLSVGTNDIWAKRKPETDEAESGFRAGLRALQQRLTAAWSERRALIAIPPVAHKEEALFPRKAAARYSEMLAESCEPERCLYVDPFAEAGDIREPRSAFSDGVHLRDYARFVRAREPELCAGLGLEAPGRQ